VDEKIPIIISREKHKFPTKGQIYDFSATLPTLFAFCSTFHGPLLNSLNQLFPDFREKIANPTDRCKIYSYMQNIDIDAKYMLLFYHM